MNEFTNKAERYCTVEESIKQSLKEMKLMKDGKLPKIFIEETMRQWQEWAEETE